MGFYVTTWRADINPPGEDWRGAGAAPASCRPPHHLAERPPNFPAKACKAAAQLCICPPASSHSPRAGKGSQMKGVFHVMWGAFHTAGVVEADGKQHGCCVLGPARWSSQGSGIRSVNYSRDAMLDFYYPANRNFWTEENGKALALM